jgi:hypothetical protein
MYFRYLLLVLDFFSGFVLVTDLMILQEVFILFLEFEINLL